MKFSLAAASALLLGLSATGASAAVLNVQPHRRANPDVSITVDTSKKTTNNFRVVGMLEANIGDTTDGGLAQNLLVNHAYQDGQISQWSALGGGSISYRSSGGISSQIPYSLNLAAGGSGIGISNPGWAGGIGYQANTQYTTYFYAKTTKGSQTTPIAVRFVDGNNNVLATTTINAALTTSWNKFSANLTPSSSTSGSGKWQLVLPNGSASDIQFAFTWLAAPGWNGQPLRSDIAQAYADLKPAYVRMLGGNDIEGNSVANRYRWNETIGDITKRPGRQGVWTGWNNELFGLHESLNYVESIGAEAVWALFAAYHLDHTVESDYNAIAQEAVNVLHYITDTSGSWASLRASNGRQNPWKLNFVEVGNEDFIYPATQTYQTRWNVITSAIKSEFGSSRFKLVGTWDGISGWEYTDLHDYQTPQTFRNMWTRFDSLPRDGRKYMELEYMCINVSGKMRRRPFFLRTLADSASFS